MARPADPVRVTPRVPVEVTVRFDVGTWYGRDDERDLTNAVKGALDRLGWRVRGLTVDVETQPGGGTDGR